MKLARNQHGVTLVVALLLTLIVAAISVGLAVASRSGTQVSNSFKSQNVAFESAVGGLERAAERIRLQRYLAGATQDDFDTLLTTANGGGTLANSVSLAGFGTTNGFANNTSDVPTVGPAALDASSYQVFLTNGGADAVTSTNDTDDTITLTAFGSGPSQSGFAALQAVFSPNPAFIPPPLPGLLTMPGPEVVLDLPNGNASEMDGDDGDTPPSCYATVAITTAAAYTDVEDAMMDPPTGVARPDNYTTCNPGGGADLEGMATVDNFIDGTNPYGGSSTSNLVPGDPNLTSIAYLNSLVAQITSVADYVGTGSGTINLGSVSSPRINVINGNYTLQGGTNGYGILVVTGVLTMNGTPGYHGTIYVIGQGHVDRVGGGTGLITCGGILVANTVTPYTGNNALVGIPTYEINGGGNSEFLSTCEGGLSGTFLKYAVPMMRVSFQQLR